VWDEKKAGEWVRPVSARPDEEVSEYEREYEDGSDPRVLDVIDVPLLNPKPKLHQQENWLLDPDAYWQKVGRLEWKQVVALAEDPPRLWVNESSTRAGMNDEISFETAKKLKSSLALIHVKALRLRVFRPGADFGDSRLKVQGQFRLHDEDYWLGVTDPVVERAYKAQGEGQYAIGECCLTISIGEPYKKQHNNCYKLIAAMIPKS
jgi:hypothetical protein